MQAPGWAQIHRDLRVEVAREGLVVDVRENRGGHTSQLVVEKLARRIVGWAAAARDAAVQLPAGRARADPSSPSPTSSPGSDGDIVNAAIKALGIGPVVGTRTWGGVIGIDSRYRLVDGTLITQPKYAFWLEGYEWGVENHGVDPDVEVVQRPQDYAAGRDASWTRRCGSPWRRWSPVRRRHRRACPPRARTPRRYDAHTRSIR